MYTCKASVDRHPFSCLSTQPIYPMGTEDTENEKESRGNKTRIGFNEDPQSSQHSHVRVYFGCLFCQTNREQQWDSSEPVGSGSCPTLLVVYCKGRSSRTTSTERTTADLSHWLVIQHALFLLDARDVSTKPAFFESAACNRMQAT